MNEEALAHWGLLRQNKKKLPVHVIIALIIFAVYLADWLALWQITIHLLASLCALVEYDSSAIHSYSVIHSSRWIRNLYGCL
jgi:hypothetical protein